MKLSKILFLLSLLSLFLMMFYFQQQKAEEGIIYSISHSQDKTTIYLENKTEKLIIFGNERIDLKKGDNIFFEGKKEVYRNEKQIIISKIIKVE